MTQTETMPCPPPGLADQMSGVGSMPQSSGRHVSTAEDRFRREIICEIETNMQSKIEEILKQGRQMLQKENKQWKDKFDQVTAELGVCRQRVQALAAENIELKQVLFGITESLWPQPGASVRPPSLPPTMDAAVAGLLPTYLPAREASVTKFPPVPDFPIPFATGGPPPGAPVTQISLADSLGEVPVPPPPPSLAVQGSAEALQDNPNGACRTFTFTLRKADGADLGISVSHNETDQVLRVEGIKEKGAVEAWNKMCVAGGTDKAVLPGDHVLSVNSISYDTQGMLEECRDKQLLRLTVMRGDPAAASPKAAPTTTLRADASVFVPGQQSPCSTEAPPSSDAGSVAELAGQTI